MEFDNAYDIYLVRLKKATTRVWKSRHFFVKSYDRIDGNLYDGSVVGNTNTGAQPIPWLQLKGHWLQQAGFKIDALVMIRVMDGCLVLTIEQ